MKQIILLTCFILVSINISACQQLEKIIDEKTIDNYQNYLIEHPRTHYLIEITDSLRKMWDRINLKNYHCDCHCNCIDVIINPNDEILVEGKRIKRTELLNILEYSINNPDNRQDLPEFETIVTDFVGPFCRSKGIIDIISNNQNTDLYSEVIEIAKKVFENKRDYWASSLYGEKYENLSSEIKMEFDILIPYRIRFERFIVGQLRLPYPPAPKVNLLDGIPDAEEKILKYMNKTPYNPN